MVDRCRRCHREARVGADTVEGRYEEDMLTGSRQLLVEIEEPCRHELQFGGMCADCGADMTT